MMSIAVHVELIAGLPSSATSHFCSTDWLDGDEDASGLHHDSKLGTNTYDNAYEDMQDMKTDNAAKSTPVLYRTVRF